MREATYSSFEELAQTNFDLLMDLIELDDPSNVNQKDPLVFNQHQSRKDSILDVSKPKSTSIDRSSLKSKIQHIEAINKYTQDEKPTDLDYEIKPIIRKPDYSRLEDLKVTGLPELPKANDDTLARSIKESSECSDPSLSVKKVDTDHSSSKIVGFTFNSIEIFQGGCSDASDTTNYWSS